ncbi:MAG: leucine-rich repeat domain-containing protein [Bacteroidaceae bacterium]|nr:leucine-rich repeat domain-containing protein [Bacteroidaceae bacterium]
MKKHLLSLFAALTPLLASAQTEINDIWYNLDADTKQAEVTSGGLYSGSITIPATVTYEGESYSVTGIGDKAFYDCSGLTTIDIPEGVTTIGGFAFKNCRNLTAINIPENSQLMSIGVSAFYGCGGLTVINIPEGVTSIEDGTFEKCYGLASINIPEGVTSIEDGTFEKCYGLASINIPESVTSIKNGAFRDCCGLTTIDIPEGVTSIERSAFHGCWLTAINIPENSQLKNIGEGAFYQCRNLTAITIPENVTSIGESAFLECHSLTTFTISENSQLKSIGKNAFEWCSNLTAVHISDIADWCKIKFWGSCVSNPLYFAKNLYLKGELVTELTFPEGVTSIGDFAFYGYNHITSITIPEGVTDIGFMPFAYCKNLTTITLPASVEKIGKKAFYECSSISDVYNYAEKLPSVDEYIFSNTNISWNATLHVPASALETYKVCSPWSSFANIVVLGTGVGKMTNDNNQMEIYDLSGRRVEKAEEGIYIVNGRKTVIK